MYTTLIKNQEEEGLGSAGKELAESSLAVLYEQNEVRRHVRPEHKGAGEGKRLFLIGKTKGTREGPMEFPPGLLEDQGTFMGMVHGILQQDMSYGGA